VFSQASTSFELARTAGRIALTFMPVILLTNRKSQIGMKIATLKGNPPTEEGKAALLKKIRNRKVLLYVILLVPAALFWATIIASLEKTPLTGRSESFLSPYTEI
jgi:hypothetical protein